MLERDGSNIGQYLLSLREASVDAFEGYLDALRVVVPYVRDLQATISDAIERRAYLEMTEEGFKVPGWLLSTGTLRVAALLRACVTQRRPRFWLSKRSRMGSIRARFILLSKRFGQLSPPRLPRSF